MSNQFRVRWITVYSHGALIRECRLAISRLANSRILRGPIQSLDFAEWRWCHRKFHVNEEKHWFIIINELGEETRSPGATGFFSPLLRA